MQITTEVYKLGKPNLDMCGQFKGYSIHLLNETISSGLIKRLVKYTLDSLNDLGFYFEENCEIKIETTDGDMGKMYRYYHVTIENSKGGIIGIQGIGINKGGWPDLDHGLTIGVNYKK